MRHQVVSCDCCQREVRDPEGWFAIRYFHGMELDVPMVQIEEVMRWNDQNERNPDMEREYLCSPSCVCKRLRSVLKRKQKARMKALVASAPALKQIEAPKQRSKRALIQ